MKIDKRKIYAIIGEMSRMAFTERKKFAAAGLMLMFGCGTAVVGHFCPIRQQETVAEEVLVQETEDDWETEESSYMTASVVQEDTGWQPAMDELNLAHYFPDGADQTQITQSLAGQIFKTLMTHDENWISQIYDMSDVTPLQMAQKLGKPQSAVMGKYNPEDSKQNKDDPSTWTINSFKNIRMTASDGDGKAITPYSNVREIMSMANLYTYYKGVTDYDLFLSYTKSLWDQSHSYTVSLSDIYYCDGCIGEEAQLKQKEELEKEAKKEESGISYEDAFLGAEKEAESEEEAGAVSGENLLDQTENGSSDSVIVSNKTSAQRASEEASRAESKQAVYESSVAERESRRAEETTKSGLIVSSKKASWQTAENESESLNQDQISGQDASKNSEDKKLNNQNTETLMATASDAVPTSAQAQNVQNIASDSKTDSKSDSRSKAGQTQTAPATSASSNSSKTSKSSGYCPGHVDLIIHMKITGLNEEKQNLFAKDLIGNDPANIGTAETSSETMPESTENIETNAKDAGDIKAAKESKENVWPGWNESTIAAARSLAAQDWFEKYGLTVSAFSGKNPLTNAEIEAYMAQLPAGLSEERLRVVRFALNSVGKVPYYWGGKASRPNYDGNSFGILTTADYKGRVLKGLDCSGWIGWVYWSATGKRLPYESTSGLAATGTNISRDQLKPGDIIVRTGTDAHVIMFLGWTSDGKIQCIHESSTSVNNVTVAVRDANWPYYRRLIND